WGARVHDDHWGAFGGQLSRDNLRFPLRELVVVAHLRLGNGGRFVSRGDNAVDRAGQADATDRAGVDDARATCRKGGFEDVPRPVHVGRIHRGVIGQPEVVTGGDMETPVATAHRAREAVAVRDIAGDALHFSAGQAASVGIRTEQRLDAMATGIEFVNEVRADETRGAGDKTIHGIAATSTFSSSEGPGTERCTIRAETLFLHSIFLRVPVGGSPALPTLNRYSAGERMPEVRARGNDSLEFLGLGILRLLGFRRFFAAISAGAKATLSLRRWETQNEKFCAAGGRLAGPGASLPWAHRPAATAAPGTGLKLPC